MTFFEELRDGGITVASLDDDAAMLSSYNPQDNMELHVIDIGKCT
jgi:hypothetical protein